MKAVTPTPLKPDIETLRQHAAALNQAARGELWPFVSVSASYSAGASDLVIYVVPAGTLTITLPAASKTKERVVIVKRANNTTHTVTIQASSGSIDGGASTTLTAAYQAKSFHSDGSNYWSV